MAFHHRKSLISKPNKDPNFTDKFADDSCYLCYVCPDNCYLSPPPPPPPASSDSSKYHIPTLLILMLCVLGVAFLALSYLTISRYRNSRSRSQPPPSPETLTANFAGENHSAVSDHPIWLIRTVGLPQSVIDSISSFAYRKGDGLIDGDDCAVCLNGFRQNEIVRLLPKCTHAFHLDCIDTWLRSHKNCPVCRAPIVREDGTSRSSSSGSGGEDERENDDDSRETRPIILESDDLARSEKVGVIGDVADRPVGIESFRWVVPPVRRSFSMNLSRTYEVGEEGCSDHTRLRVIDKENSSRVKRSFSFSGKMKNGKITI